MNDNFSSMYGDDLNSNDQPTIKPTEETFTSHATKSPRAKMHTKMVVTFVGLVVLAAASIGVLLVAASKSQDQRSQASESRCPGLCATKCLPGWIQPNTGLYSCSQKGQVCCLKPISPTPSTNAIICGGMTLTNLDTGKPISNGAEVASGTNVSYNVTGCTTGWSTGIRYSYDERTFLTPGKSTFCSSNGEPCVIKLTSNSNKTGNFNTVYFRTNLKNTINGINYWCKFDGTWATDQADPAPAPYGYTCRFGSGSPTWAKIIVVQKNRLTPTPPLNVSCNICQKFDPIRNNCVPDNSVNGRSCGAGGTCNNGQCTIVPTPTIATNDIEPNNSISQAQGPIGAGTYKFYLSPQDMDDYIAFVPKYGGVEFEIVSPGNSEVNLSLYDSSYKAQTQNVSVSKMAAPSDNRQRLLLGLPAGQKYYLRINNKSGDAQVYTLTYKESYPSPPITPTVIPSDIEPNNSISQAQGPLSPGVKYYYLSESDPDDYFYFVPQTVTNEFEVISPYGTNVLLSLYDESYQSKAQSGGLGAQEANGKVTLRATFEVGKKYYLRIQNQSSGQYYSLRYSEITN